VWSASLDQEGWIFKEHTHHDAAIETLLTDGDNHVLAITIEDLGARDHGTIGVRIEGVECMNVDTLRLGLFSEGNALAVADLFDSVGLSGRAERQSEQTPVQSESGYEGDGDRGDVG